MRKENLVLGPKEQCFRNILYQQIHMVHLTHQKIPAVLITIVASLPPCSPLQHISLTLFPSSGPLLQAVCHLLSLPHLKLTASVSVCLVKNSPIVCRILVTAHNMKELLLCIIYENKMDWIVLHHLLHLGSGWCSAAVASAARTGRGTGRSFNAAFVLLSIFSLVDIIHLHLWRKLLNRSLPPPETNAGQLNPTRSIRACSIPPPKLEGATLAQIADPKSLYLVQIT